MTEPIVSQESSDDPLQHGRDESYPYSPMSLAAAGLRTSNGGWNPHFIAAISDCRTSQIFFVLDKETSKVIDGASEDEIRQAQEGRSLLDADWMEIELQHAVVVRGLLILSFEHDRKGESELAIDRINQAAAFWFSRHHFVELLSDAKAPNPSIDNLKKGNEIRISGSNSLKQDAVSKAWAIKGSHSKKSPLEIAREIYQSGKIDRKERTIYGWILDEMKSSEKR